MYHPAIVVYNLAIRLYGLGIFIASFFNNKARLWIQGRRIKIPPLQKQPGEKVVWFHCASLGEFEQARPLIEKIKALHPQHKIVLSFFSPSGYQVRQNYAPAHLVCYMPIDTARKARQFLNAIQPDVALFVKYELWYHHLAWLKHKGIPVFLFSAIFRRQQVFFKWHGALHRKMLGMFSTVFVQNSQSEKLLAGIGIPAQVAPDTRFDRVAQIAANRPAFPLIEDFKGGSQLLIAGSTWPADERLLQQCIAEQVARGYKYIIAPHDIEEARIGKFISTLPVKAVKLSQLNRQNAQDAQVLLVDTVGQLASIYAYANIAYVGGGFNTSVHNVLEPAVYGIPVIFGPNHQKSAEALQLLAIKGGFAINNFDSLKQVLTLLNTDGSIYTRASVACSSYVNSHIGGTAIVYEAIKKLL